MTIVASKRNRTHWFLLVAILVIAAWLRVLGISTLELWHDEVGSMLAARGLNFDEPMPVPGFTQAELSTWNTLPNVVAACLFIDSGNGSAYTVLLHYWAILFGNEPAILRSLSLVASLVTIWIAYLLSYRLFQHGPAALLTTAIMATSQMLIGPAHQVRPYALAILFSLCATALLFHMLRSSKVPLATVALYGLVALASVLSHYSTCYVLLTHPVIAVLSRASSGRMLRIAAGGALALSLFAAWMMLAGLEGLEQMRASNQYYEDMVAANPDILSFFAATNVRTITEGWVVQLLWSTGNGLQYWGPQLRIIALMLAFPAVLIIVAILRSTSTDERRTLLSLTVLLLSSMAYATVLALTSGHTVSFQSHYATFVAPYAALLLGHAIATIGRSTGLVRVMSIGSAGALLLVMVGSLYLGRPTGITAPNEYATYSNRLLNAMERYEDDALVAIHSSRNAAYLFAIYAPPEARELRHYVDTAYAGISGLIVRRGDSGWVVPLRSMDPRYPRSEPKDGGLWELDHGPAPIIPDSVDSWSPDNAMLAAGRDN